MKETIPVEGMSCDHCIHAIESHVGELQGVAHVQVELSSKIVNVDFNENQVSRQKIVEVIEEQGYTVG